MKNTLAIITVVYQNYDVLGDFLRSLKKQSSQDFELYIADGSTNKKPIPEQKFPVFIIDTENKGYAHGVNVCIEKAQGRNLTQFSVVNSDTTLDEEFVEKTVTSLTQHPGSLIGGKIYYYPGYEYHTSRYTQSDKGKVLWYAGGLMDWANVFASHRGVDEVDKGQYENFEKTDFITGCLLSFDQKVVDTIGLWDEKYFLYYEDTDFCERAKRRGLNLFYNPEIIMWHKNAQSTGGSGSNIHKHYQAINRLRFGLKYAPWKTKIHLLKNYLADSLSGKNK